MYESLADHFTHVSEKADMKIYTMDIEEKGSRPASSNSSTFDQDVCPATWKASTQDFLIMSTMAVSSLMVALDATILVPVLTTLAHDLHASATDTFWIGTAYLLAHSVLQPLIATLSDIFGRRELLVPSISLFAVGSLVCAVAKNFTQMLAGRVVQGVGGAGIIALSQLVFADIVPLRQRPKYFTMVLGSWAVGSVIGPLVGGACVEKASWRWCFYINLPICAVAIPMALIFVRLEHITKTTLSEKIRKIDFVGNLLFISSLTALLVAISWGGVQFDWSSWQTMAPLSIGVVGLVVNVLYEIRIAATPFLNKAVFNQGSAIASYGAAMLQGLILYIALYYSAFYFTAAHFFGPLRTGVSILPCSILLVPGSAIVSALITRTSKFRWAIYSGWTVSTLAAGLFILFDEHTSIPIWAIALSLLGLGMGMLLSSINFSVQAIVDPAHAAQAAATYAFTRSIGMTAGVALGGSIFQNLVRRKLSQLDVPSATDIARDTEAYVHVLRELPVARQSVVMQGYTAGFTGIWVAMTVLCACGLVTSIFIKRGNLNRVLESKFSQRQAS